MAKKNLEEILKIIPTMFEINLNSDKEGKFIFEKLSEILDFDECFIYFLNPESLQLKYSFKQHANYKINDIFSIDANQSKKMFSKSGEIIIPESDFIKMVGLSDLKKKFS